MKSSVEKYGRQIAVSGMSYAPTTELGVVFLFGCLAKRLGFCIESIRPQYPDCIATRRGRRHRIEFEMWASSFEAHRHDPSKVDMVVCWENDWAARSRAYQRIQILSLKQYVDARPRIYAVGCKAYNFALLRRARLEWNVPKSSEIGDLLLMYRSAPQSAVCDLWRVEGGHQRFARNNRKGRKPGIQAKIRRLAVLKNPLTFAHLSRHPATRELVIVGMKFRGKSDVTEEWPQLYDQIVATNPSVRSALHEFCPD